MKDGFLVLQCKRGNKEALCRIYEKYKRDLLILAIALLNEKSAAEDVLHDVFTVFIEGIETFKLTGGLKSYLAVCTANRARNINRAKQSKNSGLNEAQKVTSDLKQPHESIVCNEQLRQLSDAMAKLPFEQRETILLHLQSGIRFRVIADLQGISVNTIKSRYRYGLDKLRSMLKTGV